MNETEREREREREREELTDREIYLERGIREQSCKIIYI